jgi:hypothetical protein
MLYLWNPFFEGGVHKVVKKLKKRSGREDMTVDQVGQEANQVSRLVPLGALQVLLQRSKQQLHTLKKKN